MVPSNSYKDFRTKNNSENETVYDSLTLMIPFLPPLNFQTWDVSGTGMASTEPPFPFQEYPKKKTFTGLNSEVQAVQFVRRMFSLSRNSSG
ncbi:hypothetical protein TNIN_483911 [Trichonephila inaurata madagascariensis]|uniref:Uncharacterized protein n=1 Tax=Trichonephila inaurata madagascariensis TaxID=2747483 RepID=A0A8X6YEJ8_9ARAC|nr:hypothetical protein TNIN_483911 [Trichonephila inaurata madagascariensis]